MKYKVGDKVVVNRYGHNSAGVVVEEADTEGYLKVDLCEVYDDCIRVPEDDVCLFEKYMIDKIESISEFVDYIERKFK
jgi:hypothetical protein